MCLHECVCGVVGNHFIYVTILVMPLAYRSKSSVDLLYGISNKFVGFWMLFKRYTGLSMMIVLAFRCQICHLILALTFYGLSVAMTVWFVFVFVGLSISRCYNFFFKWKSLLLNFLFFLFELCYHQLHIHEPWTCC